MNLNISIDDLRRGRYKTQKNQLLLHLVQKRAVIGDPEDGSLPSNIVRSELLRCMLQACCKTGVFVVHADRGLGKSSAAKYIFKLSAGGIMFCNCDTPSSGCYWKGVASAIGIPKEVYEKNADWETLLVEAVAAATSPKALKNGLMDRPLDSILPFDLRRRRFFRSYTDDCRAGPIFSTKEINHDIRRFQRCWGRRYQVYEKPLSDCES